jgi:hypothetical protein
VVARRKERVNIGCHRSDAGHFMPDRSRSASRWKTESRKRVGFDPLFDGVIFLLFSPLLVSSLLFYSFFAEKGHRDRISFIARS